MSVNLEPEPSSLSLNSSNTKFQLLLDLEDILNFNKVSLKFIFSIYILGLEEENGYADEFESNNVDINNDAISKLELDLKEEVLIIMQFQLSLMQSS